MNSHPFDRAAEALARRVSRRDVLRMMFRLAVGAAAYPLLPKMHTAIARSHLQDSTIPAPPSDWSPEPEFPVDWPNDVIDDYIDCIAEGNSPEVCDKGLPWCEILDYLQATLFPNFNGILELTNPFGEYCDKADCLQCCYVPGTNSCHSSFIGENVINCRPSIYGEGTRGVGLTLLLAEPPPEGTCLFTPQICAHIGMCVQDSVSALGVSRKPGMVPLAAPTNYLADPRAIQQRARVFATYALTQARHYLDEYATDRLEARPLQSLREALLGRGWATWRKDMDALSFDLDDPLFRVVDEAGNTVESASRANVARLFALLRLLTGLPNLAGRLEFIESRVWSTSERASYLAAIPDPNAVLAESLDPHIVAILKRVPMLQDYELFAVSLPTETPATGYYGGMSLAQPPTLRLSALSSEQIITLTASLDDPIDGVAGLPRPLAVDWGDGHVGHYECRAGQATLAVSHEYAVAGRYAIYAVAANNSGLRGAACAVVEAANTTSTVAQQTPLPTVVRAGLKNLSLLNLPFTKDIRLALHFADPSAMIFRAGRSRVVTGPTNITAPVLIGDVYAHNPSRLEVMKLIIEPRHAITSSTAGRVPLLKLSAFTLGVFSTVQMRIVDVALTLQPDMLAVYLDGITTPLAETSLTVETDGTIGVPLLYRATSVEPWQRVARIEIAITPDLFAGFVLNPTPTALAVGTSAAWVEQRPQAFTLVPDIPPQGQNEVFVPVVRKG